MSERVLKLQLEFALWVGCPGEQAAEVEILCAQKSNLGSISSLLCFSPLAETHEMGKHEKAVFRGVSTELAFPP